MNTWPRWIRLSPRRTHKGSRPLSSALLAGFRRGDRTRAALVTNRIPSLDDATKLFVRVLLIVDLEPQHGVVIQPVAAALLDDHHRRRLHAARIAAGGLAGLERGHESHRQVSAGFFERLDHRVHDLGTGEDVALRRAVLAEFAAGPRGGFRTGERRGLALQVHHRELAALLGPAIGNWIRILLPNLLDDRVGTHSLLQELDALRSIADVDDRLRGHDAGVGVGGEHTGQGEHARLNGAADLAGCRVVAENRERRDRTRQGVLLGRADRQAKACLYKCRCKDGNHRKPQAPSPKPLSHVNSPHVVSNAVSATIGTASARSVRGPSLIRIAPDSCAAAISVTDQPPSGPTIRCAALGRAISRAERTSSGAADGSTHNSRVASVGSFQYQSSGVA